MLQDVTAPAKVDEEGFKTFWYWINERHRIYMHRKRGAKKPWSTDKIFQQWKFCNVFRTLDKQSDWLIQHVIEPHMNDDLGLMLFNIFTFRAFNWYPTYQEILIGMYNAGFKENAWMDYFDLDRLKNICHGISEDKSKQLISGAYMIRGYLNKSKWESIPETLEEIWRDKDALAKEISKRRSMQFAVELLVNQAYWGWGPFTCYQVVLDFSYSRVLPEPRDINTWCAFGPGAIRGLEIIFPGIKRDYYLNAARWLYSQQATNLDRHHPVMTLQDVEFSLCELSGYWRVLKGGRKKERFNGKES